MVENNTTKSSLGSTALWTAAARANERAREDRLFDDPWAEALAGADGAAWAANRSSDSLAPIILRTRYFDDFLQRITRETSIRQLVLMAAGLDTRAYRLDWPSGTNLFELDQPEVLDEKEKILRSAGARANCVRKSVAVDLTGPWKAELIRAAFEPAQPSAWLLEGFLFYIPTESITHLIDEVNTLSCSGSWLGFDIINSATLTSPYTRPWIEMQTESGAPWIGSMDDPIGSLTDLGWRTSLSQAGAPDANHGRWHLPVLPVNMPNMPHNWFVTAQKGYESG
jgi:methyltransferase (TIGR00027 family)